MAKGVKEQLQGIQKAIEKKVGENGLDDLADMVIGVGKEKVETEVYNVYREPKKYKRTYQLQNNWLINKYSPLRVGVASNRWDGDKYVSKVVETGDGYDYTSDYIILPYELPRPFFSETVREVEESKLHVIGYASALAKAGVKVRMK